MKKLIVVAFVAWLWSATADCVPTWDYICTLTGSCAGVDGEECKRRPCPQEKWVDGSNLPEKSRWVIAAVTTEKPRKTS